MIIELTKDTLPQIRNPAFASYAAIYARIHDDFMQQVRRTGIKIDSGSEERERQERVERLRQKGAVVRNDGRSLYINRLSPACVACQTGERTATFFVSLRCHRSCFYCFNPNQQGYERFKEELKDPGRELDAVFEQGDGLDHIALSGGEPLLHVHEALDFYRHGRERFPRAYTRLYTCGDQVTEETLRQLAEVGLNEIRFSARVHDLECGQRELLERIALARDYVPNVVVETPVLPGTLEVMCELLTELDRLEIASVNLLELCYPLANAEEFARRGFATKARPLRVLYDYDYAGGLPIARSELACLGLLEHALDQGLRIGVHYCSLENKHTGQIYQQNARGAVPPLFHFSERDYFLKSAKVFGQDVPKALAVFQQVGYDGHRHVPDHEYLEFHVDEIPTLAGLDLEVGISYNVREARDDGTYFRELKLDLTYPDAFDPATDI